MVEGKALLGVKAFDRALDRRGTFARVQAAGVLEHEHVAIDIPDAGLQLFGIGALLGDNGVITRFLERKRPIEAFFRSDLNT